MYITLFTDTIFSPFTTTCIIFSNSDDDYGDDHYDDMDISQEIETPKTSRQQLPKKPLQLSAKNKTGVTRKNPVCPDCNKKFLKIKILEVHYRKRHNESAMPYMCRHCKKGYFTAPGLEMHVVQFHEDEESDDMAQSESDSDDDELSSEEEVIPVKSAKKSNKQTPLKSEKTSSAVNKESQHIFRCLQCPMAFFEKSAFDKHINEAHKVSSVVTDAKKNEDLLQKMTDEQRKKYEALLDEVAMSAADELDASTILLCPDCDKYFRKRSDLEAHKKNEHGVNNKTQQDVKTQDVNKKSQKISQSTSPSTISEVCDVPEQKVKPVKSGSICPICGKRYLNSSGLSAHLRCVHPHYKKSSSSTSASSLSYKKPVSVSPASSPKIKPSSEKPDQNVRPVANDVGEDTIKCFVCGHKTQTFAGLEQHIRDKHGPEQLPYRCGICSKGFLKPERVTSHAKCVHKTNVDVVPSHTVSPPSAAGDTNCEDADAARTVGQLKRISGGKFGCPECDKVYTEVRHVEKHILIQHTGMIMPFKCQFCPKSYMVESRVDYHTSKLHRNLDLTICPDSVSPASSPKSKPSSEKPDQNVHPVANDVGEDAIKCFVCGHETQTFAGLEQHIRDKHGPEQLPYRCGICSKGFLKPERVTSHAKCVHKTNVDVVQSQTVSPPPAAGDMDCENADAARTVGHLKSISGGKFGCPECDTVFKEVRSLERHILRQHTDMIMPFKCQFCPKSYMVQSRVDYHTSKVHRNPNLPLYDKMLYQCQFCPRGFSEQSSLRNHSAHVHSYAVRQSILEKRKASSPVSQQSTKKAKNLENDISCHICKIYFSKPRYVEEHFRSRHPDVPMPYSCMTCLRGFLDADRLQGHCERVHGIKVTLDQLVMTKEEPCESVDDGVDGGVDGDGVDSYTSDQDDYQSSVTEPVAVAETAAAHDDDADSYTSDQDVGSSADQLRHNLIHTMLQQPSMLSEGSSSTSATPSQQLSQVQSRAVVPTAQAFSNVIVIEPEPTSPPIANNTIAGGFQPSEFRMLPSGSYNLLNLKPMTLQKLNSMTVTNSVGNTVRATTEYPCTFCTKSYRRKQDYDHHVKVFHAATRVRFPCPICQVYSSYKKSDVKNHLQAKHQSEVLHTFNGLDGLMLNVESQLVANPNAVPPGYDVRSTAGQVQESGNDNGNDGSGSSGILNAMFQAMN